LNSVDFILNVAGLLLWLNWRSARLDPFNRGVPATLAGTVRRAEPMRLKRWHFLAALAALLFIRAWFYEHIGAAANWTPRLNLTVVTPAFPLATHGHDYFLSALLFSVASFVRLLVIFYLWLLAIAILNRGETNPDPLQKLLLVQLGKVARWPALVQLILSILIISALWALFHPLLLHIGVTTSIRSNTVLLAQGAAISLIAWLSLKFLLLALLAVHLIITYVYLGTNPVWDFINTTSRNLLAPLNRLPLRFGRIDFAPILGILLIVLLLYVLPAWLVHELDHRGRTIWPQ
jgi:uncharacterized protein YggT (Ycf19 family)